MPWRIFHFFPSMKTTCNISLFNELENAMVEYALREMPNECCGVLLGQKKTIRRVVPMRNSPPFPDSYFMDPDQQNAVFSEMEKRRETLMGIYHSHPDGPVHPPGVDLQLAFYPGVFEFYNSRGGIYNDPRRHV